jgi:hypothetical protein
MENQEVDYGNKTKRKELCKNILNNSEMNIFLNEKQTLFLKEIIKNHPNCNKKIGVGIKGFKIIFGKFRHKMFVLERTDGSYTDFSYLKCLNKQNIENDIKCACREAIQEDILNYKQICFDKGDVNCAETGVKLDFYNCHVDHFSPTFKQIYSLWRGKFDGEIKKQDLSTYDSIDNQQQTKFINEKIKEDFRIFHNENCNLRIVLPEINLKRGEKNAN